MAGEEEEKKVVEEREEGEHGRRDAMEDEAVKQIIEELKESVRRWGGTIPNPSAEPDFYMKVLSLINDPFTGITLKKLAEELGVSYSLMKNRLSTFRKRFEKGEIPPPGEEGGPDKEVAMGALSKALAGIVLRRAYRHFAGAIDDLTKMYIDQVVRVGAAIVEKYGAWCKEHGMDYYECADKAMRFFIDYGEEVEQLRRERDAYRAMAIAVAQLVSPYVARLAIIDAVRMALMENPDRGEYITDLLDEILEGGMLG